MPKLASYSLFNKRFVGNISSNLALISRAIILLIAEALQILTFGLSVILTAGVLVSGIAALRAEHDDTNEILR